MSREYDPIVGYAVAAAVVVAVGVWATVMVLTKVRGEPIPAELWVVPGALIGSILAAFRSADVLARRGRSTDPTEREDVRS